MFNASDLSATSVINSYVQVLADHDSIKSKLFSLAKSAADI